MSLLEKLRAITASDLSSEAKDAEIIKLRDEVNTPRVVSISDSEIVWHRDEWVSKRGEPKTLAQLQSLDQYLTARMKGCIGRFDDYDSATHVIK